MWSVSTNRHTADHPFYFSDLLKLQNQWLEKLRPVRGSALLFAEVAPTVTLGTRQILSPVEQARFAKISEVVAGERGGNETWHGPGQWICFILTPLQEFTGDSKGVRKAVYQILEKVKEVASTYVPDAHLREGADLGIWSARGKLASVGIKIRDGYVTSGFALNCIPYPDAFLGINPCGIAGARPDFILSEFASEGRGEAEFARIPTRIVESFSKK